MIGPTDLHLAYAAAYALGAMLCGIAIWLGLEKSIEHPALYRFGPAFVIAVALPVLNVLGALAFLVYLAWRPGKAAKA